MSGVDVLEVLDRAVRVLDLGKSHYTAACVTDARAAVAELIEAANLMHAALQKHGEWDDGCFYYGGKAASELQSPISSLVAALSRMRGAE